jgi:hypothetical protein
MQVDVQGFFLGESRFMLDSLLPGNGLNITAPPVDGSGFPIGFTESTDTLFYSAERVRQLLAVKYLRTRGTVRVQSPGAELLRFPFPLKVRFQVVANMRVKVRDTQD